MLGAVTAAVLGLGVAPSGAAADPGSAILPVVDCDALERGFDIPGARTRVTAATTVDPQPGMPGHCELQGVIEPNVRFQLKLPTSTYSGRYLQYGCGGFCGLILPTRFPACGGPHGGDMAVAATDDGHVGQGPFAGIVDASWAENNQAARNDFLYRAPHVLSRAAKRILATYYGAPPKRSYFSGCSTGGREGLLLAQRYPHDFDGIIAGAPINYLSAITEYQAWLAKSNTGVDGAPIITVAKLPALHAAVIAACDRLDGLVDGQLDDPRECRFDPVSVRCAAGTDEPGCLTPAQVDAARKLYAGPTDAHGRRLYPGGTALGSELAWEVWIIPSPLSDNIAAAPLLADNYLRYAGYPIGTPHSSLAEFQFTVRDFHRLTPEGSKGNALSIDLREFRRSGGKLILWHGWADMANPPTGTLDYYQRLWQHGVDSGPEKPGPTPTSGGLRETQEWARLFMVPSVYHCQDGDRLTAFDPFPELVGWVERGQAPERIIATGTGVDGSARTRPVFPTRCGPATTAPEALTTPATSSRRGRRRHHTTRSTGSAPTCTRSRDRLRANRIPG